MTTQLESELEYELEQELGGGLESAWEAEYEAASNEQQGLAEIIGPDTRVQVTNTTAAPFRYICNLETGGSPFCTGTLIGPRTILTAGHCISGFTASRIRVIPGRNGTLEPLPATQGVTAQLAPGFRPATATDYGVIHLRDPVGNAVGFWSIEHRSTAIDPIGTSISAAPLPLRAGVLKVNLSGYPADKCITTGSPATQLCGAQQWRAFDRTVSSTGGILEYLDDTFGGHSGSPVWVRRDPSLGGRVMVAIHISGDDKATPVVANRGVRITPLVLANIRRMLASAPPAPPPPLPPGPLVRVLDQFGFDQAALRPFHHALIDRLAREVVARQRSSRPVRAIVLVGHTDASGAAAYNVGLGQRRAQAVQAALRSAIERLSPGLTRRIRFVVQSLGGQRPVADNRTPAGRARNRRVQVFLRSS
jgi:glutamyl endopeptidase